MKISQSRDGIIRDMSKIEENWASRNEIWRLYLTDFFHKFNPQSILEIGCDCGPNLSLLKKIHPEAKLTGIDINQLAIEYGKKKFKDKGIDIELITERAGNIDFEKNSFDIVFSRATLMYLGISEFESAIKKIIEIANKGIVLMERNYHQVDYLFGEVHGRHWIRNYGIIFKHLNISEDKIKLTPISREIWYPGGGGATVIEVDLRGLTSTF